MCDDKCLIQQQHINTPIMIQNTDQQNMLPPAYSNYPPQQPYNPNVYTERKAGGGYYPETQPLASPTTSTVSTSNTNPPKLTHTQIAARKNIICACSVCFCMFFTIFLGVFFGTTYTQIQDNKDSVQTVCYPKSAPEIIQTRCCNKTSCSCSSRSASSSCSALVSQLSTGRCSDGNCCLNTCCLSQCQKCSDTCTTDHRTGVRSCRQDCRIECCQSGCCSTGTDICNSVCGTCTTFNLDYTRSDKYGDTVRTLTTKCGRDDNDCVNRIKVRFSKEFTCWYSKEDPNETSLSGVEIDKAMYGVWGTFAALASVSLICACVAAISLKIQK